MKIYVGSKVDNESSVWELQDKRVVIFHLVKWYRLGAGNGATRAHGGGGASLRGALPHEHPHGDYYQQKG